MALLHGFSPPMIVGAAYPFALDGGLSFTYLWVPL